MRIGESEKDVAYQRTGFLLASVKDRPDFHSPYYPPVTIEEWETYPSQYRSILPYEWTGDIALIRDITVKTGEALIEDRNHPERIWVDAGILMQLKTCGFVSVYSGSCPVPRDEKLHTYERSIQANYAKMRATVGTLLDGVAAVVSFVPVIGQVISVVLSAAAAVATRRPIGGAIVDTVLGALPAGTRTAVAPAAEFGKRMLAGDSVDDAAIAAARSIVLRDFGEIAATAFDLVLAASRGTDLQEAGFALAFRWFPGTSAGDRAARFSLRMIQAASRGESIERVLVKESLVELRQSGTVALVAAQKKVDDAVRALLAEPRNYIGSFEAFARAYGFPVEVARAAFMSVTPDERGALRENAIFRTLFIDPNATFQGEASSVERVRKWAARKDPIQSLTYEEARRTLADKYLAAKNTSGMFTTQGRVIVLDGVSTPIAEALPDAFEEALAELDLQQTIQSTERSYAPEAHDARLAPEVSYEKLGIATLASWSPAVRLKG